MTRLWLISLLSAGILALPVGVMAQTSPPAPDTDQTDQSEDDWRRSQRKRGTRSIYRTPNTNSTGIGAPIIDPTPISKVDTLPRESRRHVMRERARAIAESDDGTLEQADFEPSEAARMDEFLARQEQAAWDELVAESQQQDSGNVQPSDSDDSAQSGSSSGQSTDQSQSHDPTQAQGGAQGNSQEQADSQAQTQSSSGPRGGSAQSLQAIMNSIKGGSSPSPSDSQSQSGSPQGNATTPSDAQANAGQSSSGQESGSQGQSGGQAGSGQESGDGQADGAQAGGGRAAQDLSPLEYLRQTREERAATGRTRSASDYLRQGDDADIIPAQTED